MSDDDGLFDESSDEEPAVKRRKKASWIDDAAEESGDDDGEDEDDDDDEGNDDYVQDGFVVVDEDEEEKKKKDDLEDSDDDDDEEDDDKASRKKKIRKYRDTDLLDEEDLDLIKEAQGLTEEMPEQPPEERPREHIVAKTEAELRKGLFEDEEDELQQRQTADLAKQQRVERYDEDGMDDFIEDDIGDQGDILASERGRAFYDDEGAQEVTEAQMNEATEIFGTDYLDFIKGEQGDEEEQELLGYRERGIDYGLESDEAESDDEDDDLFGEEEEDDDMDGTIKEQKAEALRLKREKRQIAKAERRKQAQLKKAERRRAQLRKTFEPVQLVENFCTERDDEIRLTDIPERLFDWNVPFHGSEATGMTSEEEKEAYWIMERVPAIATEYLSTSPEQRRGILQSITNALRYIHKEKLEPSFIKRYRKDEVTSTAVREHLYAIMDEDAEWDRVLTSRVKVENLLQTITAEADANETKGADSQKLDKLQQDLAAAQQKLDETAKQESIVEAQLNALGVESDDDDDELFGDDDGKTAQKATERERLSAHLRTIKSLLEERAEKVSQLQSRVQVAEAQFQTLNDPGPVERVLKKTNREALWNSIDYRNHIMTLDEMRHILDMNSYLNLIKEGNDAIRRKEMPLLELKSGKDDSRKRSRRFDRDFYRTCVSEGLRSVCYRFLLPPNRVGIKLQDMLIEGGFDFQKTLPGEENDEGAGNPLKWVAPVIDTETPESFASQLIGSGELVLLSSTGGKTDASEEQDPLRGCRYVAAMELAYEPRVRMHLRKIYSKNAVLTTKPTKKGMDEIDAFHDYYGLHLIRGKPVKDHFPMDKEESESRKSILNEAERNELDLEMKKREYESCVQYLNILKAEQSGYISANVHLPMIEVRDDWYKMNNDQLFARENQQTNILVTELERIYLPPDGDSEDWNEERRKVIRFALLNFLLPQFESELRRDLRDAACKVGIQAAAKNLRAMAMEGPYRPSALLHSENRFIVPTGNLPIVGVCVSSDGKDATYLSSVTDRGESNDHLAIPAGTQLDSDKMKEKVILFLLQSRPAAVVVGTSGGFESRLFTRKMGEIITEAIKRWNNRYIQADDEDDEDFESRQAMFRQMEPTGRFDEEDEEWTCNVELIDDSVSQLFGRSVRSKKEFPDLPTNLKCAISIARYAKDPLGELTYAWSVASDAGVFGTEMLYLNIHPVQRLLPKTQLLREYERVLCDVTSDVGADLTDSSSFDHLRGLLMFVPGLGPRKAANLKHMISQIGTPIARRRDLLESRLLGPTVYNNAVAFLRIQNTDQAIEQNHHPLDATRLHTDVYIRHNWAVKIAFDALERNDASKKEISIIKTLNDVLLDSRKEVERLYNATKKEWEEHYGPTFDVKNWDPRVTVPKDMWRDKVEELDLDAFASMIEENGLGKWHSHLEMIKWEFRLPFADPRKPMEILTGEKLFALITGETEQSLRPGKEVTGKVIRNGDFGSRVKLEGDIPAFIPLRNLSDDHVETAEDIVLAGQIVTAVVTEVKKDHMTVELSLKMEDFRKKPSSWERPSSLPPLDSYFDSSVATRIEEDNSKAREAHLEALQVALGLKDDETGEAGKRKRIGRVVRRACTHPAFRNARNDEVDRELLEGGSAMVGEALVRPSTKSSDSLAIHWVVKEGSIKVTEVIEEDKETDASIGNILKVKDQVYGSIDELLGRFIAPMNDYVEELVNHRKFMDLPEDEVDEKLIVMKKENPSSIPYALCWMEMHPGYASLRFVGARTPRSHPIGIAPTGFTWRSNSFSSLDRLLNAFKRDPTGSKKKESSQPAPAPQPAAPPAPPASLAPPPKRDRWGAKAPTAPPPAPVWNAHPPLRPPAMAPPPVSVWAGGGAPAWPQQPPPAPPRPPFGQAPQAYGQPPPPPAHLPPPPAYAFAPAEAPSQGRGRGRTLPAWMSKQ